MKYTTEDALKEINRRAKIIKQKKERRINHILVTSASLALVALFGVISAFSGSAISGVQTEYGAFILSPELGGSVLTAVLGFVLGVLVTKGAQR